MLALKQIPDLVTVKAREIKALNPGYADMCRNAIEGSAPATARIKGGKRTKTCSLNMPTLNINYRIQT